MRQRRVDETTPARWTTGGKSALRGHAGQVASPPSYQASETGSDRNPLVHRVESLTAEVGKLQSALAQLHRFRSLVDRSGEAIFVSDSVTGRIVDANETACSWVGLTRKRLLSLSISELDLDFPLQCENVVGDHVTETRMSSRPLTLGTGSHRRRNGTSFPVEVAISSMRFGERDYVLAVARDCRDRRRAEDAVHDSDEGYRALFECTHDAIYVSARDATVVDVNGAAMKLFGYSREEFLKLDARQLYTDATDIHAFREGVEESGSVHDRPIEFRARDGERFQGLLTVTLRHASDGGILGYQCLIHPVTTGAEPPAPDIREEKAATPDLTNDKEVVSQVIEKESVAPVIVEEVDPTPEAVAQPPLAVEVVVGTVTRRVVEEIVERPLNGSAAALPRHVVSQAQSVTETVITRDGPGHLPWKAAVVLGVAVSVTAWLTLRFYPFSFGSREWAVITQAIGTGLVGLGLAGRQWRRTARGLAIGAVVLAAAVIVTYASYMAGLPFELRDVVPEAWSAIKTAIVKVSAFAVGFGAIFSSIAWYLWRQTTELEPGVKEA